MISIRATVSICGSALLAGCALHPGLPDERRISIAEVIERVQCEMKAAYDANKGRHPWLKNWAAGYVLSLERVDERSISFGGTIINTMSAGVLNLAGKAGGGEKATETGNVSFTFNLPDLDHIACAVSETPSRGIYFSGETGAAAWISRIADGIDEREKDLVTIPDSFGHTIAFVVSGNGSITPTWSAATGNATATPLLSRADTYNLKLGLVKIPTPPKEKIQKVEVTNFPAWMKSGRPAQPAPEPGARPLSKSDGAPKAKALSTSPSAPNRRSRTAPVDPETQRQIDRVIERLERFENRTR